MIPVTQPFLPPRAEYEALLDGIWDRVWLTNNGPLVHQFQAQVAQRLGLVTVGQMVAALVTAVEAPASGVRIVGVQAMRR